MVLSDKSIQFLGEKFVGSLWKLNRNIGEIIFYGLLCFCRWYDSNRIESTTVVTEVTVEESLPGYLAGHSLFFLRLIFLHFFCQQILQIVKVGLQLICRNADWRPITFIIYFQDVSFEWVYLFIRTVLRFLNYQHQESLAHYLLHFYSFNLRP